MVWSIIINFTKLKKTITLKIFNSEFSHTGVLFADQNSQLLEITDKLVKLSY